MPVGTSFHKTVVKIENADDVLTTVQSINGADVATAIAEHDASRAGREDMEYDVGQQSHSVNIGGVLVPADDALYDGIRGMDDRDIEVFLQGEGAGNIKLAAKCFVTGYTRNGALGADWTYSAVLRISGAVTRSTV